MRKSLLAATTALTAAVMPHGAAFAQETASADSANQRGNDEIIVTARRREEGLSKVPIAITALGSEALAKQSIQSESDLQSAVPGLTVRQTGGNNIINFSIRGQSIDAYTNSAPAVLPYVNEFQVVSYSASTFFDLENVQVLKGPQGTLFGRNTTGGAVLYKTTAPGDELKGYVSARRGNFDSSQASFGVTLPLHDKVSVRLAANYSDGGAYVTNLFNGKMLGGNENTALRATVLLRPTDTIRNTLTVQFSHDEGTNTPNLLYSVNVCGTNGPDGNPLVAFSDCAFGISSLVATQQARGVRTTSVNSSLRHYAKGQFAINTTELDLSPALKIKNIIGWNKSSKDDVYDFDGTSFPIYENREAFPGQNQTTRQFSEEFQIQGTALNAKLNYVLGLFYSNQTDGLISNGLFFGASPVYYSFELNTKSKGAFVQGTYNLTDAVHLTGGFRYSGDKTTGRNRPGSVFGVTYQQVSAEAPSWTVSLDYQVTPALMLYVTHRGSWRSGGLNFTAIPINATAAAGGNVFLPEKTKDIEIGAKFNGRIGDVPVSLSIDAYNQWVSNVQRANNQLLNGSPSLFTSNVPKAEITGLEGSLTVRPTAWLEAGVSGTYTNARFTDANTVVFGRPAHYGPYADVAKWSGSAFAQISHDLPGTAGKLVLRGDVYGQTGVFFSNLADTVAPGTRLPGYSIANARLNWENLLGTPITAGVYMRNIFDKIYYAGGLPTGSGFGLNTVSAGTPRTYGVDLRVTF